MLTGLERMGRVLHSLSDQDGVEYDV
jgi:hypothetical protein